MKVETFRGWFFVFWVAFLVWGLNSRCRLPIWDGRVATFDVDAMLKLLSRMGAAVSSAAGWVCLGLVFQY